MKTSDISLLASLFFTMFTAMINPIYAQPRVSGAQCVACGGMNGYHKTTCKYYNPPSKSNSGSSGTSLENEIIGSLFLSFLKSGSSSNSNNVKSAEEKERIEEEQRFEKERLARVQYKLKRYNDSIAQVKHNKLKKEMKPLEGSGELSYKGLDEVKSTPMVHFNCKITTFKGDVKVLKSNGETITLSKNESVELAVGDWIATGFNSSVKLHYKFESGGEDIMLGQQSAFNIILEDGYPIPKFHTGKSRIYSTNNLVSEKLAETQEKIITEAEIATNKLKKKFNAKRVRTPSAVTSVRGTDFTINIDSLGETQVYVIEGIVDLTGILNDNTITLTAGFLGIVNRTGKIVGVYKKEDSEMEKWWEEQ